jgi:hypothetical protein
MVIVKQKSSFIMLVLLVVLTFVYQTGHSIYEFLGWEPLPTFEFLHTAAFVCGVVWWLRAETKHSAVKPVYCQGLLVGLGWLIIIPYHLFKTRGIKGMIPLLALFGSLVVSYILAVLVFFALTEGG